MSNMVRWLVRTVKSIFDTGTVTKEIVTRGTVDILYLKIDLNETPPTTIELNQASITLTDVASTTAFLALQNDSLADLPLDATGDTIEGYKNTTLNQIIVFGIGSATAPRAIYRRVMNADKI